MTIGIDGNEANVSEQVGVSVYTRSLLEYFSKHADEKTQFKIFLRQTPNSELPTPNKYFMYEVVKGPAFWSQVFLPVRLHRRRDIDLFFAPAHYSPRFCPVPLVVTIHDVSYYYFPEEFLKKDLYKLRDWTARSIKLAKKIIAVSKNTKKDVLKHFPVSDEKITVIYNGFEKKISDRVPGSQISDPGVLETFALTKQKYLLYVGTIQPRKNINVLLDSFEELRKNGEDLKLVIVGKKGWLYDNILKKVQSLSSKEDIVITGYLPDEAVIGLYKNAFAYVLPSLYEGFGIPVLEAMSYGCPVIASYSSSLPEIGGDAAEYFDPKDPHNLTERVMEIKGNPAHRKELIARGLKRVKEFSWDLCAKQTLELLKNTV